MSVTEGETWWDVYHLPSANLVGDYSTRREARTAVREMVVSGAPRRHFRIAQWRLVNGVAVNVRARRHVHDESGCGNFV